DELPLRPGAVDVLLPCVVHAVGPRGEDLETPVRRPRGHHTARLRRIHQRRGTGPGMVETVHGSTRRAHVPLVVALVVGRPGAPVRTPGGNTEGLVRIALRVIGTGVADLGMPVVVDLPQSAV